MAMSGTRSRVVCACLVALSLGAVPALLGCGSSESAAPGPDLSSAEAKAKADQQTADAFKAFQKEQKAKARKGR